MIDTTAGEKLSRTRFAPQDPVPEWLLAAEPMHPHARRGVIRFTMPTDVIDIGDRYIIVPVGMGNNPLGVYTFDGQGCQVNAASKPVETVIVKSVIAGTDYFEQHTNREVVTQIPPAPSEPRQEVRQLGVLERLPARLQPIAALAALIVGTAGLSWGLHALHVFG